MKGKQETHTKKLFDSHIATQITPDSKRKIQSMNGL